MPIDIHAEQLLTLAKATRLLPSSPHPSTLWRWHRRGIRGVRLETVVVGGTRYTSREALSRFSASLTAADEAADEEPAERSPETERRLQRAGLL